MKRKPLKLSGDGRCKTTAPPAHVRIQNILATTDLSNESITGVRYAVALGEKLGAAVALLHVIQPPAPRPMPGMRTLVLDPYNSEVAKYARVRLKALAVRESKPELHLTPLLRTGNSIHGIITAARKRAADLIVIATHGYTGVKRVLLGSTAERVVRHAPCPVLTVPARITGRHTGKRSSLKLKKILVPIDFSKVSEDALPWATCLAAEFEAELILLHVVEKFPSDYLLGPELMNHAITPLMKEAEAVLKGMAGKLSKTTGLKVSVVVCDGKPFEGICRMAQKLGVDLIILTTHGYTGLKRVWLGSTAERTVRHASSPVLVVRELSRRKF